MAQIQKQATEDVLGLLTRVLAESKTKLRVVGDPVVVAVLAELEKDI